MQTEFVDDEGVMVRSMTDWATLILKRLRSSDDPDFLKTHGPAIDQIENDVVVLAEQILWQERDTPVVLWRMQRLLVNLAFVSMRVGGLPIEPPVMSGKDRIGPALVARTKGRQAFERSVWVAMNDDQGKQRSVQQVASRIIDRVKSDMIIGCEPGKTAYNVTVRGVQKVIYDYKNGKLSPPKAA